MYDNDNEPVPLVVAAEEAKPLSALREAEMRAARLEGSRPAPTAAELWRRKANLVGQVAAMLVSEENRYLRMATLAAEGCYGPPHSDDLTDLAAEPFRMTVLIVPAADKLEVTR